MADNLDRLLVEEQRNLIAAQKARLELQYALLDDVFVFLGGVDGAAELRDRILKFVAAEQVSA